MKKIKLNQLEVLIAVVDKGSFSAAGIELGCTQSRVSHAMAELEECLNSRLLIRTRSGCEVTAAGEAVLVKARRILALTEELSRLGMSSEVGGTVRIACVRSVGTHLLPHMLEGLSNEHPGINIDLNDGCHDYAEVDALLDRGAADIGVTRAPMASRFVSRPFVSDEYVAIVPADAQLAPPLRWEALLRLPFIHIHQPGASWIVEKIREAGIDLQIARRTASEGAALSLVSRGLGFVLLPRLASFPRTAGTKAVELPLSVTRSLVALASAGDAQSLAVKTALGFLLDRRYIERSEAWKAGVVRIDC
ncbi:MAG: LysR family transcriptional regulator [Burkholderiaceae bacterium]|jgi:DNA-binding transcriptional LysR family regulator|nr:LysR family transcriptional regulator [Burkholderiaceae bacterium]